VILKIGKEILPIEVKYGKVDINSMLKFLSEFKLKRAIILTKDIFAKKMLDKKISCFCHYGPFLLQKKTILNSEEF
jgi:hypothetical protein